MSILIKDMEMPKDEGDSIHIRRDGTTVVYRAASIDFYKAVPVPPHGRLINADELKTAFPCGESVRTECVRATIDHAQTIISADEVV